MRPGFVYIWYDTKRNKFYIGSHLGYLNDGYVCSNKRLLNIFKSRPETLRRRILEYYDDINHQFLLEREQEWLNLIEEDELHGVRYYNEKKVAFGGDIFSTLPQEKQNKLREIGRNNSVKGAAAHKKWLEENPELVSQMAKERRSKVKCVRTNPNLRKKAKIIGPNEEEYIVESVFEFCKERNLNYGNMKTALRTGQRRCSGYSGQYL